MNNYFKPSLLPVLFLIVLLSFPLFPVASTLKGYIKDKTTTTPLAGVKITVTSVKNTMVRFEMETDDKGYFFKTGLEHGMYQVTFDKKGYIPAQWTIRLRIAEQYEMEIPLEALGVEASETSFASIAAAKKLIELGKYDEAIEKITQVIEKEPGMFILFFNRAAVYDKKGDKEKALTDYKKTLEIKPDFLLALAAVGNIYAKRGEFPEAMQYYKKAYDLGIADTVVLYNYGACSINQGNNEEAKQIFERLIRLDPNYADAHYQLGIIYLGLNDNAKAREFLEKFIQLDPENTNTPVAKEILQTLQ